MTAPVLTSFPNKDNVQIAFIMDNNYSMKTAPKPNSKNITLQKLDLGKVATIKFGLWATPNRIKNKKDKLEKYLKNNSIKYSNDFFVAQYNSPWILPPFRKNEIIVSIK